MATVLYKDAPIPSKISEVVILAYLLDYGHNQVPKPVSSVGRFSPSNRGPNIEFQSFARHPSEAVLQRRRSHFIWRGQGKIHSVCSFQFPSAVSPFDRRGKERFSTNTLLVLISCFSTFVYQSCKLR